MGSHDRKKTDDGLRLAHLWPGRDGVGVACLAWGDFVLGQPVPKTLPERTALAYAAGVLMLVAGAAIEWRRAVAWGAATLTGYYALIVVILMNGRLLLVADSLTLNPLSTKIDLGSKESSERR